MHARGPCPEQRGMILHRVHHPGRLKGSTTSGVCLVIQVWSGTPHVNAANAKRLGGSGHSGMIASGVGSAKSVHRHQHWTRPWPNMQDRDRVRSDSDLGIVSVCPLPPKVLVMTAGQLTQVLRLVAWQPPGISLMATYATAGHVNSPEDFRCRHGHNPNIFGWSARSA